jgi:co-chaperonin GroES (HSP10)
MYVSSNGSSKIYKIKKQVMEDEKKWIKTAKVNEDVKQQKAQAALGADINTYFGERDKTNRGLETKISDAKETSAAEAEVKELLYEDSIKEFPIASTTKPMFNQIFISARRNKTKTESGLWLPSASFGTEKETDSSIDYQSIQKVMAIGNQVQELAVGMEVKINYEMFKRKVEGNLSSVVRKEFEYVVPIIEINGHEYIKISEREVEYITDTKGLVNNQK